MGRTSFQVKRHRPKKSLRETLRKYTNPKPIKVYTRDDYLQKIINFQTRLERFVDKVNQLKQTDLKEIQRTVPQVYVRNMLDEAIHLEDMAASSNDGDPNMFRFGPFPYSSSEMRQRMKQAKMYLGRVHSKMNKFPHMRNMYIGYDTSTVDLTAD